MLKFWGFRNTTESKKGKIMTELSEAHATKNTHFRLLTANPSKMQVEILGAQILQILTQTCEYLGILHILFAKIDDLVTFILKFITEIRLYLAPTG